MRLTKEEFIKHMKGADKTIKKFDSIEKVLGAEVDSFWWIVDRNLQLINDMCDLSDERDDIWDYFFNCDFSFETLEQFYDYLVNKESGN